MKHYFFNSNISIYLKEGKWKNKEVNTVRKVLRIANLKRKGLTIKLSDDRDLKNFNFKWKGINKPTNILSFPNINKGFSFENSVIYLGDIMISYETLLKEIRIKKIDFQDHLSHILVHGILHLKGYTHNFEDDARLMQNEEKRILKNLKIKDPYRI